MSQQSGPLYLVTLCATGTYSIHGLRAVLKACRSRGLICLGAHETPPANNISGTAGLTRRQPKEHRQRVSTRHARAGFVNFGGKQRTHMNKQLIETTETLSTTALTSIADNILAAAREDASEPFLKFKKGQYFVREDEVAIGSEFLAHTKSWLKCWIKFIDGQKVDQKVYRVFKGEKPPERDELCDLDQSEWPTRDGKPEDPWSYQYYMPVENLETGDVLIFVTSSWGGRKAVAELCTTYAKRLKSGGDGQPIIKLAATEMPTKNHGKVAAPKFVIVAYDDAEREVDTGEMVSTIKAQPEAPAKKIAATADDMDDAIPY
jgi:hypothetical protein